MSKQRLLQPWVCAAVVVLFWSTTWALRSSIDTTGATLADPLALATADDDTTVRAAAADATLVEPTGETATAAADSSLADAAGTDGDDPPPTSQPASTPTSPAGRPGNGHGGPGGHRHPGGRFGTGGPPTTEQQGLAMDFLAQHAPKQAAAIRALPPIERARTEAAIGQAYLNYQRIDADDPDLYAVILSRVELEDHVFDLSGQYRAAANNADRDAVRADLVKQLHAWADVNLKERKLRLERLKRTVTQAEEKLAADTAHRERMIDERLNRITRTGPDGGGLPTPGVADDPGR